ncbi:MAG: acetyl-CoA carboxylase biotin carboxylase subunit [Pseudomonadota bacterium]
MTIDCVLIANRGEIACRVIRTVKALGMRAIAVYSDADANAPHVMLADDAVGIGPPAAQDSYLNIEKILEAAQQSDANAVHPGYGFLSENDSFAQACEQAGLVFIGPTPEAIALMGNKAAAKRHMISAGVPCVPGYEGEDQSDEALMTAADEIGYPIMVKAAAGGGGRGMRLVHRSEDLVAELELARFEAASAFGSDELILEKAILRPRHVEIQVFADTQGNVIHLGERDCSVQRRHQKVVEESPCPVLTDGLREKMGAAAVEAARSISYRGAGTVEFLLDDTHQFYFLEMNTRLQVEHPVTELVTGLDLVALQLKVASGEPLGIEQADVQLSGHAIEVRLCAEDVAKGFQPSAGRIDLWCPAAADCVRIDAGIETGQEVSPFYDSMLAKVITWGETRESARRRLIAAMTDTGFFGPASNRDFLIDVLETEAFIQGEATTALIEESFDVETLGQTPASFEHAAAAAVLAHRDARETAHRQSVIVSAPLLNWSSGGTLRTSYLFDCEGISFELDVHPTGINGYRISGDDECHIEVISFEPPNAQLSINGRRVDVLFVQKSRGELAVALGRHQADFQNRLADFGANDETDTGGRVTAPMHGLLQDVLVKEGDRVEKGSPLFVLEAMKMQHRVLADVPGTVERVCYAPGDQVDAGALLLEIIPVESS